MTIRALCGSLSTILLVGAGGLLSSRPGLALVLLACGAVPLGFIMASLEREIYTLRNELAGKAKTLAEITCPQGWTTGLLSAVSENALPLYLSDLKPVTHANPAQLHGQRVVILSHE